MADEETLHDLNEVGAMDALQEEKPKAWACFVCLSPAPVLCFDTAGRIVLANPAARELLRPEGLVGCALDDVFPGLDGDACLRCIQQGDALSFEHALGPRMYHFVVKGVPTLEMGHVYGVDVTDLKRTEAALRESEARYRTVSDLISDYAYALRIEPDHTMVLEWATSGFTRDTGVSLGHEIARAFENEAIYPEDRPVLAQRVERLLSNREDVSEYRIVTADGAIVWLRDYGRPIWDEAEGRVVRVVGAAQDITARKRTEDALRENEALLRGLVEGYDDVIAVLDLEGRFLYYNAPERYGLSEADVIGKTYEDFWPAETAAKNKREFDEVLNRGQPLTVEDQVSWQGETLWFLNHKYPIRDRDGAIIAVGTISRDITARKQMEEAIRASLREKEVLLQEIHHRVKNNLQVVSSLLSFQSRHTADTRTQAALAESQDRVRSMALVYEKLHQSSDLVRVDFGAYLRSLTSHLLRSYHGYRRRVALRVDVADVKLDLDDAVLYGLIVNELVTNALKHAFPPDGGGKIRIVLRSDEDRLILTVRDDGVGLPADLDLAKTESLGLQLVLMLVKQLRGTLTVGRENGTAFEIVLPGNEER